MRYADEEQREKDKEEREREIDRFLSMRYEAFPICPSVSLCFPNRAFMSLKSRFARGSFFSSSSSFSSYTPLFFFFSLLTIGTSCTNRLLVDPQPRAACRTQAGCMYAACLYNGRRLSRLLERRSLLCFSSASFSFTNFLQESFFLYGGALDGLSL